MISACTSWASGKQSTETILTIDLCHCSAKTQLEQSRNSLTSRFEKPPRRLDHPYRLLRLLPRECAGLRLEPVLDDRWPSSSAVAKGCVVFRFDEAMYEGQASLGRSRRRILRIRAEWVDEWLQGGAS